LIKFVELTSSNLQNYVFNVQISREPCLTCYSNCDLTIGLYQQLNTQCEGGNSYYSSSDTTEKSCEVPTTFGLYKQIIIL